MQDYFILNFLKSLPGILTVMPRLQEVMCPEKKESDT